MFNRVLQSIHISCYTRFQGTNMPCVGQLRPGSYLENHTEKQPLSLSRLSGSVLTDSQGLAGDGGIQSGV